MAHGYKVGPVPVILSGVIILLIGAPQLHFSFGGPPCRILYRNFHGLLYVVEIISLGKHP